jgi:hypothetical protein
VSSVAALSHMSEIGKTWESAVSSGRRFAAAGCGAGGVVPATMWPVRLALPTPAGLRAAPRSLPVARSQPESGTKWGGYAASATRSGAWLKPGASGRRRPGVLTWRPPDRSCDQSPLADFSPALSKSHLRHKLAKQR